MEEKHHLEEQLTRTKKYLLDYDGITSRSKKFFNHFLEMIKEELSDEDFINSWNSLAKEKRRDNKELQARYSNQDETLERAIIEITELL